MKSKCDLHTFRLEYIINETLFIIERRERVKIEAGRRKSEARPFEATSMNFAHDSRDRFEGGRVRLHPEGHLETNRWIYTRRGNTRMPLYLL